METIVENQLPAASPSLHPDWQQLLSAEFNADYMKKLRQFLVLQAKEKKTIYPNGKNIFAALNLTPPSAVKAVILGQDPYHGPGQAHGLSFSVPAGVPPPPSLKNIFLELESDLKMQKPKSGDLTSWAKQGVLLLNTVLTVEDGKPASHRDRGWEIFTDKVIHILAMQKQPISFLLWGSFAQKKASMIPTPPHLVLQSVHPSPLSAYRGFLGCKHFSKTNDFLVKNGRSPIDWSLN